MSDNGWIKVHRKMLDNPIVCKDADHLAIWMYLLMNATHEAHATLLNGKKIILQPGQLVTGRKKIASELEVNEHKVDRVLKDFENEQQIEQRMSSGGRLISIQNWNKYQQNEQPSEQQVSNECATSEQRVSTKQEIKECKNERNNPPISPLTGPYSDDQDVNEAVRAFLEHRRKKRKPMTNRALSIFLKKLKGLSEDPATQVMIIDQAIEHGWDTVYPLREEERKLIQPHEDTWDRLMREINEDAGGSTGQDNYAGRASP